MQKVPQHYSSRYTDI